MLHHWIFCDVHELSQKLKDKSEDRIGKAAGHFQGMSASSHFVDLGWSQAEGEGGRFSSVGG